MTSFKVTEQASLSQAEIRRCSSPGELPGLNRITPSPETTSVRFWNKKVEGLIASILCNGTSRVCECQVAACWLLTIRTPECGALANYHTSKSEEPRASSRVNWLKCVARLPAYHLKGDMSRSSERSDLVRISEIIRWTYKLQMRLTCFRKYEHWIIWNMNIG